MIDVKISSVIKFAAFGISTILLKRKKAILATIILTDKCNLSCKHCAVNNINCTVYPYKSIKQEMYLLYNQGIRILFFCGGETFLWEDDGKYLRDLVLEAKEIGFLIVNVVTNGTFKLDLPEADLILLSLDGSKEAHNNIRGETYDEIIRNITNATSDNICLYMAINKININDIENVSEVAKEQKNIRAVSFNFHTPYPDTQQLSLSIEEKQDCANRIEHLIKKGYPVFNLKSALKYVVNNNFKTPCYQCIVLENGKQFVCGRCIEIEGLCDKCGYFFAAEYSMIFNGNIKVIFDMLNTYLRYV
jgi:MoaA/NifB/PqqE/SkfB family radical SAM enzyme